MHVCQHINLKLKLCNCQMSARLNQLHDCQHASVILRCVHFHLQAFVLSVKVEIENKIQFFGSFERRATITTNRFQNQTLRIERNSFIASDRRKLKKKYDFIKFKWRWRAKVLCRLLYIERHNTKWYEKEKSDYRSVIGTWIEIWWTTEVALQSFAKSFPCSIPNRNI